MLTPGAGPDPGNIETRRPGQERIIMKYTTVKISEIAAHPTMRLDPDYWIKKKKRSGPSRKRQAASAKKI